MKHVVGDAHWQSPMASVCWWLFPSELSPTGWEVYRILFHFQRHCIASLRTLPIHPSEHTLKMCYDSGTTPKTLCDDPSFFTNIGYFKTPSSFCLGDDDTTISALGQGTIDIIINNKYRIQQHAILTTKTLTTLMSTQDHIRYHDCSVVRSNNNLHISFPTFSFVTTGKSRFEFDISPGKASTLPILWSPAPELLCTSINIEKNTSLSYH